MVGRALAGRPRLVASFTVLCGLLVAVASEVGRTAITFPAADVTIAARPSIVAADHPITLFGAVRSGRPGETIEIQTKDCGQSFYRAFSTTHSQSRGLWSAEFFPGIGTSVRAVWNGRASRPIAVRQRAMLRFAPKAFPRTRFVVSVVARAQFWRRTVVIERLDRRRAVWNRYRSVVLTKQNAPGQWVWTSGEFTARLPTGTMLRAVLPSSQAGPCYLTSVSLPLRTG